MSMIGNLTRIPENIRVALHRNPEAINELLYPDFDSESVERPGFLSRLFGKKFEAQPQKVEPLHILSESDKMDIDKGWHALHFLFTGSSWEGGFPQGFLVSCGESVGDVDVGYGPAKSFSPSQVKEISGFLSGIDRAEMKSRFDPEKMNEMEIYPDIWKDCRNPKEEWEYIEGGLDDITRFVGEAAEQDMALLVYIN